MLVTTAAVTSTAMASDDENQPGWAAPPANPGWGAPPPEAPPPGAPAWGSAPPTSPIGVGSSPPPMMAGQPGTRPRRRWVWVLVAAVVAVIGLYAVDSVLFAQKIKPPIDATNAFVHDLRYHDYASAYRQLCTTDRHTLSQRALVEGLSGDVTLVSFNGYSVNPFDMHFHGDRVTVGFTVNYGYKRTRSHTLRLVKEHGKWRPCGFSEFTA